MNNDEIAIEEKLLKFRKQKKYDEEIEKLMVNIKNDMKGMKIKQFNEFKNKYWNICKEGIRYSCFLGFANCYIFKSLLIFPVSNILFLSAYSMWRNKY